MIKITKGNTPKSLLNAPTPISEADITGKEYYKKSDVKAQLACDQHNKCAYCERMLNGDFGDVEHFRPKGGFQQSKGDLMGHKGYYWLANVWENLLLSCSECNRSCKKNLFPLADPLTRNTNNCDISQEEPLLINPTTDNPEVLIGFRGEFAVPVLSIGLAYQKAVTTIEILDLNGRKDLVERRRRHLLRFRRLDSVLSLLVKANAPQTAIDWIKDEVAAYLSDDGEFLGTLRNQMTKEKA